MTNLVIALALIIYNEAADQSREGKMGVASVIWTSATANPGDRLNELDLWYEITKKARYSAVAKMLRAPAGSGIPSDTDTAWTECLRIADHLVFCAKTGESTRFKVTGPWTHYYAHRLVTPSWARELKQVRVIQDHTFGVL